MARGMCIFCAQYSDDLCMCDTAVFYRRLQEPKAAAPPVRVFACAIHGIGYSFGCSVEAKSMNGALKALRKKLKTEKRQGVEEITIRLTDAEPQL
jgi:hypothetical protein